MNGADKPTFVKSALEHAGIKNNKKQEKFARLFNEYKGLTPELLKALERDKSFKKSEIANLRTSFQLADLTRGDFSVVKAIKEGLKFASLSKFVRSQKRVRRVGEVGEGQACFWPDHAAI